MSDSEMIKMINDRLVRIEQKQDQFLEFKVKSETRSGIISAIVSVCVSIGIMIASKML